MKRTVTFILALVIILGMVPATVLAAPEQDYRTLDSVEDMVNAMPLRDKITQMLMIDFRKWGNTRSSATDFTVMNDQVRQIVADYRFGAVIHFANNIKETEQTFNLNLAYQEAATSNGGLPLILCADQEGGSVYRLGSGTALPGNMALGATYLENGTKYALAAGKVIGSELSALGINTNLAPVVDINNNANNPVIGLRSYSDDAAMVGNLASASIQGMAEYNVIGCAKHFPGHGDTATDSHYGLPMVNKSLAVLKENELKPYEVAIDQGIEMIMTAHIFYPQLENDKILSQKTGKAESLPATMSDDIITGLLKGDMGFRGVVVTDAMNMAGVADSWNPTQAAVIAIQAGVDMLCMPCHLYCQDDLANLDAILESIQKAVEDGTIPMSRINDAVTRILTLKKNRGILNYDAAAYSLENARQVVGSAQNRAAEREMSAAAVTLIKNENNVLPLKLTSSSKVLMLVPYDNESAQMIMGWNRARDAGRIPEGAEVKFVRFSSSSTLTSLKSNLEWADTYIINSEISSTASGRMTYGHWLSKIPNDVCNYALEKGKTAIISSVDKPYDVQLYPNAAAIVAAYGCKGSSVDPTEAIVGGATGSQAAFGPNIRAAVEVILGTYRARGPLPLDVPVYDAAKGTYTDSVRFARGYGLRYQFCVTFQNGDSVLDTQIVEDGRTAEKPADPAQENKVFLGWYTEAGEAYTFSAPVTDDLVLYARFVDPECSHDWQDATCAAPKTCSLCGDTEGDPDPSGHALGPWAPVTAPTCTQTGSNRRDCALCDYYETAEVAAAGHRHVPVITPPTCADGGYTTHTCSVCGDTYQDTPVPPTKQHTYTDNWDSDCDVCGESRKVAPAAPVVKIGCVASSGKNKLTWESVPGAVQYQVYRMEETTGQYLRMLTTSKLSYINTSAKAGTKYYYYVVAVDAEGRESRQSNLVSRTCDLPRPALTLENLPASGKIKVSWKKIDGAKSYRVYRATAKDGPYKLVKTTTSTSYTNTAAEAGKTYWYKVVAIHSNSAANSEYSSVKYRTCDLPRPVVNIKRSSKGKPSLSWKKIEDATSYKVYRATSENGSYKLMKTTTKLSYTNTSAVEGKTYYYKVVAVHSKSAANSAYSLIDSITSK